LGFLDQILFITITYEEEEEKKDRDEGVLRF